MKEKTKKIIKASVTALGAAYITLDIIARKRRPGSVYLDEPAEKNPMEGERVRFVPDESDEENADGQRGHLEDVGESERGSASVYEKYIKRAADKALSFSGLVLLSPLMAGISLAIKIEDPGPVLFTQKRVGKDKQYFRLHKFRSMRMDTPHDVPTHMLENPDQYITKVGKFLRAHSLDELPQIWDIFMGNMSVVGPRPALWNQDILVSERDKYGANDVKPGLTGWAQINGRDELEIPDKARLDGEYTKALECGGREALAMDMKCFAGSLGVFAKDDSVVEGGTGEIRRERDHQRDGVPETDPEENYACDHHFTVDHSAHRRVLIVGADSYIGDSFRKYAADHYGDNLDISVVGTIPDQNGNSELDMMTSDELGQFDYVYHLAGIAHADIGSVDDATKEKYYRVNTDLAVKTAHRCRKAGVKTFIFMSSMIVYGDSAPYGTSKVVTRDTVPAPSNFYGDSKWQADKAVRTLATDDFHVYVLRPPMIYGRGSKGNYPILSRLARKMLVFPDVDNSRSMLYIENLCEFLCQLMLSCTADAPDSLVFMPQNPAYTRTSDMVRLIAQAAGHTIRMTRVLDPAVALADHIPGRIRGLVDKAFGNNAYDETLSHYDGIDYQKYDLRNSMIRTESDTPSDKKVLMVASVASMIDQFNRDNIELLISLGYDVDVAANFRNPENITHERCKDLMEWLNERNVDCYQIDFDRNVADIRADRTSFGELDRVFKGQAVPVDSSFGETAKKHPDGRYTFMHCHSPIGGAIGRVIAHRNHVKAIYTAHGFHFFKGGPVKSWILYYPVEKELSRITDVLITINREDYQLAKDQFHAGKVVKIPGVGIDSAEYADCDIDVHTKRKELALPDDAFVLLSVGELAEHKNQQVIIDAMKEIKDRYPDEYAHIYYVAAGQGKLEDEYKRQIREYGLDDHVRLIGFRTDIPELCHMADCFVHPSIREGLGLAPLEAMAAGLPLISSYVHGIRDYASDGKSGVCLMDPRNADMMMKAIIRMYRDPDFRKSCSEYNHRKAQEFDISRTEIIMRRVYTEMGD